MDDVPVYAEGNEPDEGTDEFAERDDCVEVPADLLELHEVLEWDHGGPLP